jgi:uncharacterized membrane protein
MNQTNSTGRSDWQHTKRLRSVDALRGLIMVWMALDHANYFIAQQHSSGEYWGGDYPVYQSIAPFLVRFVTHFSAPGFFFLMGAGMAMYSQSRQALGWTRWRILRHFLLRGLVLVGLQLLVVNQAWVLSPGGWGIKFYFGVLYALGEIMILTGVLVWLRPRYLAVVSLALLVGTELLVPAPQAWGNQYSTSLYLVLFAGGQAPWYWVNYPVLAWMELAVFGMAFGHWLAADREKTIRRGAVLGAAFLAAFVFLRGLDGFGNLRPMPVGDWMDFLNPVKYPPSITFTLLTTGGNLLVLWLLSRIEKRRPNLLSPLVEFGRTPLFFYVLHLFVYAFLGLFLAPRGTSLALMLSLWLLGLAILYPLCRWYGAFKRRQLEGSLLRFL